MHDKLGMGNGELGMGNWEWAIGNKALTITHYLLPK
jgi:hypothetical protein